MSVRRTRPAAEITTYAIELFDRLQYVIDITAAVVAKYPRETVPSSLEGFLGAPRATLARMDRPADSPAVLRIPRSRYILGRLSQRETEVCVPVEWLNMHQSELTKTVRAKYWAERRSDLALRYEALEKRAQERETEAKRLQEAAERAHVAAANSRAESERARMQLDRDLVAKARARLAEAGDDA